MTELANQELWSIFNARRVKQPELRGLDLPLNQVAGWLRNRRRVLPKLRDQVKRINAMEPEVRTLSATRFRESVNECRDLARLNRLTGPAEDRALALAREGAVRGVGLRPFDVQLMGALAMLAGAVSEMATGEGKTLTASVAASILAWGGKPVHVITVNDYLVARDAEEMAPVYEQLGVSVGHVVHDTPANDRAAHYRSGVVYVTSKELVADFLRDQIALGTLRNNVQTQVGMLMSGRSGSAGLLVPGLFRVLVDEADSLLIDEAVTPLIISNSPDDEPNEPLYTAAHELALQLRPVRDFTIDRTVRQAELTVRGKERLTLLAGEGGFWQGERRREELVQQALTAQHCFVRDEQYLVTDEGKIQIIDEFTGRVMADRSWRHGLHQAIEIKEQVKITADKENLARLSFQRFFRQYPLMCGMTGTAWESAGELWQIYKLPVVRIPTNKPCIRVQLPTRMFETMGHKYDAVVRRVCELNEAGVPVLVGTRSVLASEEVSRRLSAIGISHRVLNATQTEQEANIVAEAGQMGRITVATNMAGRGTDIKLGRGVVERGGLQVIATEPHGSHRVDRQLYGRAARQGDPGTAQLFCSIEDDLFSRHAGTLRRAWKAIGADRLIRICQSRADRLARFNRRQVLRSDDWMDQMLPF